MTSEETASGGREGREGVWNCKREQFIQGNGVGAVYRELEIEPLN